MTLGLLDLSIVTDRLLRHLSDSEAASRLWDEEPTPPLGPLEPPTAPARTIPPPKFAINFTGLAPDAVRDLPGCSLSLYLFHVAPDKFYRNTFPILDRVDVPSPHLVAPRARRIPHQPLALTLYYLLSVHSGNYIEEQQAMSIALKCFHEHPVVTATVPMMAPAPSRTEEFTLTMEPQSVDEIGRLWQAVSSSLRLSAVYRASVIFLEPEPEEPRTIQYVKKPAHVSAYPEFAITRSAVDANRLVTITGTGFVEASIVVKVDNATMSIATTDPPGDNTFHVVDPTKLLIQLPLATSRGQHRLGVQLDPLQPEELFTLDVPP